MKFPEEMKLTIAERQLANYLKAVDGTRKCQRMLLKADMDKRYRWREYLRDWGRVCRDTYSSYLHIRENEQRRA